MPDKIDELEQQSRAKLDAVADTEALERFRIQYLGSKGAVKGLMKSIGGLPQAQRRDFGQRANALRRSLQEAFEEKKKQLAAPPSASSGDGASDRSHRRPEGGQALIDVTEPGTSPMPGVPGGMGRQHIITQTIDELIDVFGRMGFEVATGPEVEDERHNFIALNIPEAHPARDPLDNFYLTDPDGPNPSLLRTQTSTVQIRVMEQGPPPIRVVSLGRVYRPDEHDATHYSMFHQVEGLYVDRRVSMADLKTALYQFAHAYFGPETEVKLVPSYFPFTEPSAELYVKIDLGQGPEWMELGGCGMVDPAVFEHVGYDPERWSGYAWGLGIERIAMRKYQIPDIRWLFENDVRFLRQF